MNNSRFKIIILKIIIWPLATSMLFAQSSGIQVDTKYVTSDWKISLDHSFITNTNHPYIDFFSQQDNEYIVGLYALNKSNMSNTPQYENPAIILTRSDGNNSLIFTIVKDNIVSYDTLRNSVHPNVEMSSSFDFLGIRKMLSKWRSQPQLPLSASSLEGDLPKGAMTSIEANRRGLKLGVLIPNREAHLTVEILDQKNRLISTLVDKRVYKGWNNYKWKRKPYKTGIYKLNITIDGETLSQLFETNN